MAYMKSELRAAPQYRPYSLPYFPIRPPASILAAPRSRRPCSAQRRAGRLSIGATCSSHALLACLPTCPSVWSVHHEGMCTNALRIGRVQLSRLCKEAVAGQKRFSLRLHNLIHLAPSDSVRYTLWVPVHRARVGCVIDVCDLTSAACRPSANLGFEKSTAARPCLTSLSSLSQY